jgi:anti-sigma factor ChrR (cupin superfamily)
MSQEQETTKAARTEVASATSPEASGGNGAGFDSIGAQLIRTGEQPWIDMGGGNQVIVLRVSKETGFFSLLLKAPAGQVNAPHTHIGAADFYVISGGFDYRGGSARAGDWVYEPAGAIHDATTHPEDTIYLANSYGPIAFHGKDGGYSHITDWRAIKAMADRAGQPRPDGAQRAPRSRPEAASSGAPRVGAPMAFDALDASLIRTNERPWLDMGGGNEVIVLRVSKETGFFSLLIKAPAGQVNAPHTHIGAADFYVISGGFDYRGGSARVGDWVYEPAGAVHEATTHPMDTVYLANSYGPVAFHGKDGRFSGLFDWRTIAALAEKSGQKA